MPKFALSALLLSLTAAGFPAVAATSLLSMNCAPPVLQVPMDPTQGISQFLVECQGRDPTAITPEVRYFGELSAGGTPPYDIKASYTVNSQSAHSKRLGQEPGMNQLVTGTLVSSAISAAALPAQFAAQTVWDAQSGVMSVEEYPGTWRAYSIDYHADTKEPWVVEAGITSTPVHEGRATAVIALGSKYSRFAGKDTRDLPLVTVHLMLRRGLLDLEMGDTRYANEGVVQTALLRLDSQPSDMQRAWALGARAQYLGLKDEARYAARRVAAFHPEVLEEFQAALAQIRPFDRMALFSKLESAK